MPSNYVLTIVLIVGIDTISINHLVEFLRRPPIDRTSELIENVVKSNETKRVKSYFESGCLNVHDSVQNMSKCKYTSALNKHFDFFFLVQVFRKSAKLNDCVPCRFAKLL